MLEFDDSLTNEFVIEAREHLSTIEEDFLALEKLKSKAPKELIDKVFRAIHSIKGAAGFLGFHKINDLAHVMETILQMLRSKAKKVTSTLIDELLKGVDLLRTMIDDIQNSNNIDIQATYDKLCSLLAKNVSVSATQDLQTKVELTGINGESINFDFNQFTRKSLPAHHEYLYVLKYDLQQLEKQKKITPVKIVNELLTTGMILEGKINIAADDLSDDLENQPLNYEVLYSTVLEPDLVTDAAYLSKDHIIQIDIDKVKTDNSPAITAKADEAEEDELSIPQAVMTPSTPQTAPVIERSETVRINVELLDRLMTLAGELVLVRNQHLMAIDKNNAQTRGISQRLDIVTTELQETIMRTRMQPVSNVFGKLPRIVRDLSQKLSKEIEIITSGDDVELDKTILEQLADPLTHIIRNCCDHGIELPDSRLKKQKSSLGHIWVKAYHEGGQIYIEVCDDGKGINSEAIKNKALKLGLKTDQEVAQMTEKELINLITLPGFSTAEQVSDVSGRGVGMDVVKTSVEKMGGNFEIRSTLNKGTTIIMRMPLTLAIIPCLVIAVGDNRFAIPQINLDELVALYDDEVASKIETTGDREVYRLRNRLLSMVRLDEVLKSDQPLTKERRAEITKHYSQEREILKNKFLQAKDANDKKALRELRQSLNFAVVKAGNKHFGLIIDQVLGQEEIVVKPMHPKLKNLGCYAGATVMGDGKVALILNVEGISAYAGIQADQEQELQDNETEFRTNTDDDIQSVLIFKSGSEEQFAVALPLVRRIEKIKMSQIERVGGKEFVTVDNISTRIIRLENALKVSPCEENDEMFLLLPKNIVRPFGILISSLTDVRETSLALNVNSHMEDGMLGTSILREQLTIFLDIYRLIEKVEPEWFQERRVAHPPPQNKIRILLAEDVEFFQQLVKKYLEADNYKVDIAENGLKALELLSKNNYDMVISDLEMPEMDGWQFIKTLRKSEKHHSIPAVALTALDTEEDRQRTIEAGFNHYLVKIDREILLTEISRFLREIYKDHPEKLEAPKRRRRRKAQTKAELVEA